MGFTFCTQAGLNLKIIRGLGADAEPSFYKNLTFDTNKKHFDNLDRRQVEKKSKL